MINRTNQGRLCCLVALAAMTAGCAGNQSSVAFRTSRCDSSLGTADPDCSSGFGAFTYGYRPDSYSKLYSWPARDLAEASPEGRANDGGEKGGLSPDIATSSDSSWSVPGAPPGAAGGTLGGTSGSMLFGGDVPRVAAGEIPTGMGTRSDIPAVLR